MCEVIIPQISYEILWKIRRILTEFCKTCPMLWSVKKSPWIYPNKSMKWWRDHLAEFSNVEKWVRQACKCRQAERDFQLFTCIWDSEEFQFGFETVYCTVFNYFERQQQRPLWKRRQILSSCEWYNILIELFSFILPRTDPLKLPADQFAPAGRCLRRTFLEGTSPKSGIPV